MKRDGDIIKALGYVAIYAAYLEEGVDMVVERLSGINGLTFVSARDPISKKIKWCQSVIESLNDTSVDPLKSLLQEAKELLEKRNDVIHGRIYAGSDRGDNLKSGRIGIPKRLVTADELYDLAEGLFAAQGRVRYERMFATLEAINKKNSA